MEICICLPSYNESKNIQNITKLLDSNIQNLNCSNSILLLNIDNSSPDNTSKLFLETKTSCKKESIVIKELGKGYCILNFIKYCKKHNIEKCLMIDSDLKTIDNNFIKKMLKALTNADFVLPNYKRTRFEGNVTNHFVYPMLYLTYGKLLRQPIAGDYAFSKKFLNSIPLGELECNEDYLKYGIDLFLLDWALKNNFKIKTIYGGKKDHSPSYDKTEKIFIDVFKTWISLHKNNFILNKINLPQKYFKSINSNKKCNFIDFKLKNIKDFLYGKNLDVKNYEEIRTGWIKALCNALKSKNINFIELKNWYSCFIVSYWIKFQFEKIDVCEKELLNNAIRIKEKLLCKKNFV